MLLVRFIFDSDLLRSPRHALTCLQIAKNGSQKKLFRIIARHTKTTTKNYSPLHLFYLPASARGENSAQGHFNIPTLFNILRVDAIFSQLLSALTF